MKVLVTGANGFLGSNLLRILVDEGCEVRAFIEEGTSLTTIQDLPVEIQYGNLLEKDSVIGAAAGCDVIIHTAASTMVWPTRTPLLHQINVVGTENIIAAVKAHKISKLVHVGTANSFGPGSKTNPGNEENPFTSDKYKLDYIDTKYEAQQLILKEVKENGLPAVIVNPTFMIGPLDSKPGTGTMIIAINDGKVPACSGGGRNYAYVKDVARGIYNSIEYEGKESVIFLGNANLTYKEMFSKIGKVLNKKAPSVVMPNFLVRSAGLFGSFKAKITGTKPTVSYNMARIGCDEHYYTCQKAVSELKLPQTDIEHAIKEAVAWFKENQYIKN